ncbi:MAG: transposase, partial [Verrucomicrobiota bacterium]
DRYGRPVVSLAVLADEVPGWRPAEYEQSLFGCRLLFEYPACKLLDLQPRLPALIRARNPAAVVVAAHLATHRTKDNPRRRFLSKWRLARELYELEFNKAQVLELMRLLGWLLTLPQPLELDFRHQVLNLEQQKAMPFITSFERFAREEGLQQGEIRALREGILDNLDARFGTVPAAIQERLPRVADVSRLRHWHRLAVTVPDMATFLREFDDSASTGHGASPGTGQR